MNPDLPLAPLQFAAIATAVILTLCAVLIALWPRSDDERQTIPDPKEKCR